MYQRADRISCFILVHPLCPLINLANLSITPFQTTNTFDEPLTIVDMTITPAPDEARIGEQYADHHRAPFTISTYDFTSVYLLCRKI